MREIKFRAWNTEMEHMVFPSLEFGREIWPCTYKRIINNETDDNGDTIEVILEMVSVDHILQSPEFEVMQFTGLLDKNGKEIFEHDVIQFRYNDKCEELGYGTVNAVVEFERGMFVCKQIGFDYEGKKELPMSLYEFMQGEEITIVGNIFENPELLKP